jgi:hypothetical protein
MFFHQVHTLKILQLCHRYKNKANILSEYAEKDGIGIKLKKG